MFNNYINVVLSFYLYSFFLHLFPFTFTMRLLVQVISIDVTMLQFPLLLLITIVVLSNKPVIAFPRFPLSPRQELGLNFWNFVDWGKVGGTILTGLDGMGKALESTPQSQEEEEEEGDTRTTTIPDERKLPGLASPGPLLSSPAGELDLGKPSGKFIRPPISPPCDPNIFSPDCGKFLHQVIFTTGCGTMSPGQTPTAIAIAQNTAILDELERVATGPVLTTTSDHCGVFMFVASLPAAESERIRLLPGVSGITSDTYLEDSKHQPQSQPGLMEPAFKRGQLRNRDRIRQSKAPANLQFISKSPMSPTISDDFVYDSSGGKDTEVFYIGPGVALEHPDFANNPITHDDFIFANDVSPADTLGEGSTGTCVASLVRGTKYGVSKRTRLRPVRTNLELSSVMNAMVQILNYVADRVENPGPEGTGNGFVMLLNMLWSYMSQIDKREFETLLEMMVGGYGIVTVVPGGRGFYPAEYAKTRPVISVGAVDATGAKFSWSPGQGEVTVTAPGAVLCASNDGGERGLSSTLPAAAQAAGLAAYFLTLYPQLRENREEVPLRVKNWMVSNSWARLVGGLPSIWNLMETDT